MLKEALIRQSLSKSEQDARGVEKGSSSKQTEQERCQQPITNTFSGKAYCLQGNGIDRADTAGCNGKGWTEDVAYTLNTIDRPAVVAIESHPQDNRVTVSEDGVVQTLSSRMGTGGGNIPLVAEAKDAVCYGISAYESNAMKSSNPNSGVYEADTARTLDLNGGNPSCNQGGIVVVQKQHEVCHCIGNGQTNQEPLQETVGALDCMHDQKAVLAVDCRNGTEEKINGTLQSKPNGGTSLNLQNVVRCNATIRRLTPMECERLQGFPDGWTDIGDYIDAKGKLRKTNDGARYKALGNSIAIPPWTYVLSRLNEHCVEKTMASLFDGIGGFPLIWERLNGKGSCLWASEIEDFPIAVTKKHFGEQGARDDNLI